MKTNYVTTKVPMGLTIQILAQVIKDWSIHGHIGQLTEVLLHNKGDENFPQEVNYVSVGDEVKHFEDDLTVFELQGLVEEWKDRQGEVKFAANDRDFKRITAVIPGMHGPRLSDGAPCADIFLEF